MKNTQHKRKGEKVKWEEAEEEKWEGENVVAVAMAQRFYNMNYIQIQHTSSTYVNLNRKLQEAICLGRPSIQSLKPCLTLKVSNCHKKMYPTVGLSTLKTKLIIRNTSISITTKNVWFIKGPQRKKLFGIKSLSLSFFSFRAEHTRNFPRGSSKENPYKKEKRKKD